MTRIREAYVKSLVKGIIVSLIFSALFGLGQTPSHGKKSESPSLSDAADMGIEKSPILNDDPHLAVFHLVTSWIPGEQKKGYVRYRISVIGSGVGLKEAPKYIDRLNKCDYTLILYDSGNFVLRRIPLVFMRGVADSGDVTELNANDLSQMSLAEYKMFVEKGVWQIGWSCK